MCTEAFIVSSSATSVMAGGRMSLVVTLPSHTCTASCSQRLERSASCTAARAKHAGFEAAPRSTHRRGDQIHLQHTSTHLPPQHLVPLQRVLNTKNIDTRFWLSHRFLVHPDVSNMSGHADQAPSDQAPSDQAPSACSDQASRQSSDALAHTGARLLLSADGTSNRSSSPIANQLCGRVCVCV